MIQAHRKIEVTIISAAAIRRYAQEALPHDDCAIVEQTLLDDDRARALVNEIADPEQASAPSEAAAEKIRQSLAACQKSIVYYQQITQEDGPKTVLDFAASRFSQRWRLLEQINKLTSPFDSVETNACVVDPIPIATSSSLKEAVSKATIQDSRVIAKLRAAFAAASGPFWKAKIADWIASIEADSDRIAWMTRTLAAPTQS